MCLLIIIIRQHDQLNKFKLFISWFLKIYFLH